MGRLIDTGGALAAPATGPLHWPLQLPCTLPPDTCVGAPTACRSVLRLCSQRSLPGPSWVRPLTHSPLYFAFLHS